MLNVFSSKNRQIVLNNLRRKTEIRGNHPADVPWHSALGFCSWIGARLPTSAEWERVARGRDGWLYPWGNDWDATKGNVFRRRDTWPHKTSPVTAYPSGQSPEGVMDLIGNTYEWTCSTGFGYSDSMIPTELVICRSCCCNFEVDDVENPAWLRNRATAMMLNEMHFGGAHLVGFRPVLDEWQKKAWSGF